jgi:riboflavin kinase/FMN adenylyltransferase
MKVKGIVEKGAGKGTPEFVPTINLLLSDVPAGLEFGVYTCKTAVEGVWYGGALHYGPRTSVDNLITFEVNLFEFDKQIYGQEVEVEILQKIREIVKFDSHESLKSQILKDIEQAKLNLK